MNDSDEGLAASRYIQLESIRFPYLRRARRACAVTIPALLDQTETSTPGQEDHPTPSQSIGARGLNNLASKLLLALFPPNEPFVKLTVEDFVFERIAKQNGEEDVSKVKSAYEEALTRVEQAILGESESMALRVDAHEALKHLLAAGNVCFYVPPTGTAKVYHLDRYVCKRDGRGAVLEIIVKEMSVPRGLPPEVRVALKVDIEDDSPIAIYTRVTRGDKGWEVCQEGNGVELPGSRGRYALDKCPYLALRCVKRDGEDYGRSYIEEYQGDLNSVESLSKSINESSAACAKTLFLVKPSAVTKVSNLARAANLSFVQGLPDDIRTLQLDKGHDLTVAANQAAKVEDRLRFAFLLNASVQRAGERVTAEEIRYVAQELEDTLGGLYSLTAQEFQYPLAGLIMDRMQKAKKLPKLPSNLVKPSVVTGISAIGRGHDRMKLTAFLSDGQAVFGPETMQRYVNVREALSRRAVSDGIVTNGLIYTEDEIAEKDAQQHDAQMQLAAVPNTVNAQAAQDAAGAAQPAQ